MLLNDIPHLIGFANFPLKALTLLQAELATSGNFINWTVGLASVVGALVIAILPWNLYFNARDAIAANPQSLPSTGRIARGSLILAIALHLSFALILSLLAATGTSPIGYWGALLALLSMGLRPLLRLYRHLNAHLATVKNRGQIPDETEVEGLQRRVSAIEATILHLEEILDPLEPYSWVAKTQEDVREVRQNLTHLAGLLERLQGDATANAER